MNKICLSSKEHLNPDNQVFIKIDEQK